MERCVANESMGRGEQIVSLAVAVAIPVAAGALSGLAGRETDPGWYEQLDKPPWQPPSSVFGPVWTTLYALMGFASWLVWRRARTSTGAARRIAIGALVLFAIQLVVNLTWTPVFFGLQRVGWALVIIVALLALLAATIERFARVRPLAALLLLPYLAWVAFASTLNGAIWWLNR